MPLDHLSHPFMKVLHVDNHGYLSEWRSFIECFVTNHKKRVQFSLVDSVVTVGRKHRITINETDNATSVHFKYNNTKSLLGLL